MKNFIVYVVIFFTVTLATVVPHIKKYWQCNCLLCQDSELSVGDTHNLTYDSETLTDRDLFGEFSNLAFCQTGLEFNDIGEINVPSLDNWRNEHIFESEFIFVTDQKRFDCWNRPRFLLQFSEIDMAVICVTQELNQIFIWQRRSHTVSTLVVIGFTAYSLYGINVVNSQIEMKYFYSSYLTQCSDVSGLADRMVLKKIPPDKQVGMKHCIYQTRQALVFFELKVDKVTIYKGEYFAVNKITNSKFQLQPLFNEFTVRTNVHSCKDYNFAFYKQYGDKTTIVSKSIKISGLEPTIEIQQINIHCWFSNETFLSCLLKNWEWVKKRGKEDRILHMWDTLSRTVVWSSDVGEYAQSACFSPDGEVGYKFRKKLTLL